MAPMCDLHESIKSLVFEVIFCEAVSLSPTTTSLFLLSITIVSLLKYAKDVCESLSYVFFVCVFVCGGVFTLYKSNKFIL